MARSSIVFLTLVQVACSLTVITFTTDFLTVQNPWGSKQNLCYLSGNEHNPAPCHFAIAAGFVSLGSAVLASCLRFVSFDCCGLGPLANIALASINSVWWIVAAAILTASTAAADAAGLHRVRYRHTLLIAAWLAALAEVVHAILACVLVGNNVCNWIFGTSSTGSDDKEYCGGCCGTRRRRRRWQQQQHHHHHHQQVIYASPNQQPLLQQQQPDGGSNSVSLWRSGAAWLPQGASGNGDYLPPPPTAGQPYTFQHGVTPTNNVYGQPLAGTGYTPFAGVPPNNAASAPPLHQQQQEEPQIGLYPTISKE